MGVVRAGDLERGHAITAHSPRPRLRCTNARIPANRIRRSPQSPPDRKHRWAGAATPTQRNTNRPQQPPRRASGVFHGSNPYRKDNPCWSISNVTETPADRLRTACGIWLSWLIGLPRRAGARLHALNDAEARWWHWHVTEARGGLVRQYRDARFAALRSDPTLRRDELGKDLTAPETAPRAGGA